MHPKIDNHWDFYIARIDDAPASVLLDFGFRREAPLPTAPHLLWLWLPLGEPDEHGMGTHAAAAQMKPVEDRLVAHLARTLHAVHVGRIRGQGHWQLHFYAPTGDGLEAEVQAALGPDARFHAGTQHDPQWDYYREFLWPDVERDQWIKDRNLCDHLEERGDALTVPRPVDHRLYFPSTAARAAFEAFAEGLGFEVRRREEHTDGDGARPYSLDLVRADPVDLDSIHAVVMTLVEEARKGGGTYDGWGCPLTSDAGSGT